jgi:hypothetical protein
VRRSLVLRYCPKCRGEFQDWVEKCIDCGTALLDTRPEGKQAPEYKNRTEDYDQYTANSMVMIGQFGSTLDAELYKQILESEGIESQVVDFNANSGYHRASGTVILLVRQSDAEKAAEILKSVEIIPDADTDVQPDTDTYIDPR